MDPTYEARGPRVRAGLILLFLAAGLLDFFSVALATGITSGLRLNISQMAIIRGTQVAVMLGSLAAALALRKNSRPVSRFPGLPRTHYFTVPGYVF
jgi:hypothetical protein